MRAALLAVVFAGVGASPAAAELLLTPGTVTPASISFPRPTPLVYTLQVTAVGQDETFKLEVATPPFGRADGAALGHTGSDPRIDGPAVLAGAATGKASAPVCDTRGDPVATYGWDVRVPVGTTSTLSFDFTPSRFSPWPSTTYDLTFRAEPQLAGGGRGSLAAAQEATVRGPGTSGRRGVEITLRTNPATTHPALPTNARVRLGQRIAVSGSTRPALRNRHVSLWVDHGGYGYRPVRWLRTDARGRFRGAVTARPGLALYVRSPRTGDLDADRTCPLGFSVGR